MLLRRYPLLVTLLATTLTIFAFAPFPTAEIAFGIFFSVFAAFFISGLKISGRTN